MRTNYAYIASSWRNPHFDKVIAELEGKGIPHYNFRNPEPNTSFAWHEVGMPEEPTFIEYMQGIHHPRAIDGFHSDMSALIEADKVVLILPCGRSAHLELGYAVGMGKPTAIYMGETPVVPELMYKMVNLLTPNLNELIAWLEG